MNKITENLAALTLQNAQMANSMIRSESRGNMMAQEEEAYVSDNST